MNPFRQSGTPPSTRRALALAAALAAAAGCTTPPSPLENPEREPVAHLGDVATRAKSEAPQVVPLENGAEVRRLLAEVTMRGNATLEDCFRIAEQTSEEILSGDEDRLQSALRRDLAAAGIQPSVSIAAYAFVQDRIPATDTGFSGGTSFSQAADREQWALTVRQPIYKGFAELRALRAAEHTEAARAASIETMRAGLRRAVARAYYGVLSARAEVRTLEESERLDRVRIDEMRARQESGIARRTEVLLLESQLERTRASLRQAKTRHDVTRTTLQQLVGVTVAVPLVEPASPVPPLPLRDEALAEAIRSRPELRAAGLLSEAAQEEVGIAEAGHAPTVSFVGNWYLGRSGVSDFQKATDWDAQINVDLPIFDGGAVDSRVRTAKSALRKARIAESATLRSIVLDIDALLVRGAAGEELLASFEKSARVAKENLSLLEEEYRQGIATNLEVLTAQNVLQQAQLDVENQRLTNRLDRAELLIAIGRTELTQ